MDWEELGRLLSDVEESVDPLSCEWFESVGWGRAWSEFCCDGREDCKGGSELGVSSTAVIVNSVILPWIT